MELWLQTSRRRAVAGRSPDGHPAPKFTEESAALGVVSSVMSLSDLRLAGRYPMLWVWAGGLAVATAATAWSLTHGPATQRALEAFLSMAALLFINDMLPGHGNQAWVSRWPVIGLTATVVVFFHDPLSAVLAVLVAAPIAGLINGQSIFGQVTKTALWLLACGMGLLVFGVVVYAGHRGVIIGSGVLVLVYAVAEYCIMAVLASSQPGSGSGILHRLDEICAPFLFGGIGALYALSWRSPQFGSLNLDGGQMMIVASLGIVIGWLLGGSTANLWHAMERVTNRIVVLVALVGLAVIFLPRGLGLPMLTLAVITLLAVSVRARTLGGAFACIGGLANLIVIQLNGGMPTNASAFFRLVGPAHYAQYAGRTYLENANTRLPVLDDRVVVPHPFPFAEVLSAGDMILGIGLMVLIVERMISSRKVAVGNVTDDGLARRVVA